MRFLLVVTMVLCMTGSAAAQTPAAAAAEKPERARARVLAERAKKAESLGDRAEALKAYEEMRQPAPGAANPEAANPDVANPELTSPNMAKIRAAASLQAGRHLEALATGADTVPNRDKARERYEEAVVLGDASQKVAAQNSLGVLLLRQGDRVAALSTLKQVDLTTVPAKQAFVLHSNLGQAYEANGEESAALAAYQSALSLEPTFTPALDGVFRVLVARKPPAVAEVVAHLAALEKAGRVPLAVERARQLVLTWPPGAAEEILPSLARLYAVARVTPEEFETREWPVLSQLPASPLRVAVDQLRSAFQDVPFSLDTSGPPREFYAWAMPSARTLAMVGLLRSLGERDEAAQRPWPALTRYWAAWLLSRDGAHALAVAAVLEAHPNLQREPAPVLDRLLDGLFDAKARAYQSEDWPSILRLHVVLAGLLTQRGDWSNPGDPRSPLFQWERAARAAERVAAQNPEVGRVPGIHLNLARCYEQTGNVEAAWRAFLESAERFLAEGREDEARAAVTESAQLGFFPTGAEDKSRYELVMQRFGRRGPIVD